MAMSALAPLQISGGSLQVCIKTTDADMPNENEFSL